MMSVTSALKGLTICATDGRIGTVSDFLFDDRTWRVRWVVIDTGNWLPGRLVLVHPQALGKPDFNRNSLTVALTKERVENSPDLQRHLPVSRQMEQGVFAYYGWDPSWGGGAFAMDGMMPPLMSMPPIPSSAMTMGDTDLLLAKRAQESDPNLRSVSATDGYQIHATDGEIGHVSNFLMDDASWTLRYLIVDTRNWWPGKHVLLSPSSVIAIDWVAEQISVDVTQDKVRLSPAWDPASLIHGSYEAQLREHYAWPPLM
jgi:sporulation protein YlmC with PRC-barrel domain